MKNLILPLAVLLLFAHSEGTLAETRPSFDSAYTSYGYVSSRIPPLPPSSAKVVYAYARSNRGSFKAAALFDTFQGPKVAEYIPKTPNGQPEGGTSGGYYRYTRTLIAGDFGVHCVLGYYGAEPIGKRMFKDVYEETGMECHMGYYPLSKPNFNLPIRHEFTDSESNFLIQSVLQNGGVIEIDGSDSYFHQLDPIKFPAHIIRISCEKNICAFFSERK